jgi:hypothetical protein
MISSIVSRSRSLVHVDKLRWGRETFDRALPLSLHPDPLQHPLERRVFVDPVMLAAVCICEIAFDMFICDGRELLLYHEESAMCIYFWPPKAEMFSHSHVAPIAASRIVALDDQHEVKKDIRHTCRS